MKNIKLIKRKVSTLILIPVLIALTVATGCKKGAFDINNNNPNKPTTVQTNYILSAALTSTANLMYNGNEDILDNWIGYWTQSGAYTASNTYVLYQLTSGTGSGNWDGAYNNLSNYNNLLNTVGTDGNLGTYRAIGMIMESFVFQRIVDLYNSAPYSSALKLNAQYSYTYDSGSAIYKSCISKIDSAVAILKSGATNINLVNPAGYDVMFSGHTDQWIKFANTLKLKMLLRQTQSTENGSLGDAAVKSALAGYTTSDFLGAGEDASVNPGYSTASNSQENPLYADVVKDATGTVTGDEKYYRANAYAVKFYKTHNDIRDSAFYLVNGDGEIRGRVYGSTDGSEANSVISALAAYGMNPSATEDAPIIPAFESLFLQAEALQRGYITGATAGATYNSAVAESFRILGLSAAAAGVYTSQNDATTNFAMASDKITLIITQKWAACNTFDPLESYSDWRRLNIPASIIDNLSIYPGNQATHIPYRLPYPTSELNFNRANVPDGGTGTESLTSKIFWMPTITGRD